MDTGSDIAKDAADVVLLEKSLLVLEHGVAQGRVTHGECWADRKVGSAWAPMNTSLSPLPPCLSTLVSCGQRHSLQETL